MTTKGNIDKQVKPLVSADEYLHPAYSSDATTRLLVNGTSAVLTKDWEALKLVHGFVVRQLIEVADARYRTGQSLKTALDELK